MEFPNNSQLFSNPLMSTPLFGLKLFGYIFESGQRKRLYVGVIFTFAFISFNVSQFLDLALNCNNINELMINIPTTFLFTTTVARMINFYQYRNRYKALINETDKNIQEIVAFGTDEEKRIYYESVSYARKLLNGFIAICLLTANSMCFYSLFQSFLYEPPSEPPTILRSWVPTKNVWKHFYLIYTWQLFIMWLGQIIVPCWHAFIVSLLIYCICLLKIFNFQLKQFKEYNGNGKQAIKMIKTLINKHRKVINFIRELIDLNQVSLFLDFVIFSALLCALLFQTARVSCMLNQVNLI